MPNIHAGIAEAEPRIQSYRMRRLELYRFRYYDRLRRRWIQARYVLEAPAIRCQYSDYELIGAPEIRHVAEDTYFNPFRALPVACAELRA